MRKFALIAALSAAAVAQANMQITEWAYAAGAGEYIEFTNTGLSPIDLSGWSFDDDSRVAGTVDLSPLGVVQPGASVILTEAVEADFRAAWSIPGSVAILGGNTTNLGRNDEINIFDAADLLADRLAFGDQTFPGTIRTQNIAGLPATPAAVGANDVAQWVLAADGDAFGSYISTFGDIGNPGVYVPEPTSALLLSIAGLALVRRR